jgi:agmatine deiminase
MCVSTRQFKNARALLPPHIRVVEMSNDDAWMRDVGPNFVVNDRTVQALVDYLDVDKMIWLPRGCPFDTTDGHVDDSTVFARLGGVLLTWTEDRADLQYEVSQETFEILSRETDARGRPFTIHKVIQPKAIEWTAEEAAEVDPIDGIAHRVAGERIAVTYVKYYIGNTAVFVPTYEDSNDAVGLAAIQACFPERRGI